VISANKRVAYFRSSDNSLFAPSLYFHEQWN